MPKLLVEIFRGRFLEHPIHAMLVHFPSALFPTAWFFEVIAFLNKNPLFSLIAFYLLGLGILSGVLAACFGAIDYARISPKESSWKKASIHALLNVTWLIIFGTLFGINMMVYPKIEIITLTQLIVFTITVFGLIVSNFLGGELVYRHNLGTINSQNISNK